MARVAWQNRDQLGYAWRILNHGVCDGCALGTKGIRDWTIEGSYFAERCQSFLLIALGESIVVMGATLKPAEVSVVTKYLASNFPPRARSNAPTITGNVQANFHEFKLPSRAFPHDPYAAADGSIWYTSGTFGGTAGFLRYDPKTKLSELYPLPKEAIGVRGGDIDSKGVLWGSGSAGVLIEFDRDKCKAPKNGPNAAAG